jgi:hypothetical protein
VYEFLTLFTKAVVNINRMPTGDFNAYIFVGRWMKLSATLFVLVFALVVLLW